MIIKTKTGMIEGFLEDGVNKFFGIPYAQAPVGALRFRKTVPVSPWEGCLETKAVSCKCPQLSIPVAPDNGIPQSEDCLYLNIWSLDSGKVKKPVLFWIFGGGLSAGEGSTDTYDGSAFAKNGDVVVVTFNYRVGIFGGFFNFSGFPGCEEQYTANAGLYDVLTALQWVRDNIQEFGGDPDNITICGESAGASIAAVLLSWPKARGLFAKAALESTFNYGIVDAADTALPEKILACAGLDADHAAEFFALPTEGILKALSDSCGGNVLACGAGFQAAGEFSGNVAQLLAQNCADVPILIGYNHDEGVIFTNPQDPQFPEKSVQMTRFLFESVIETVLEKDERKSDTFIYRYDYVPGPMKAQGMGALHSAEMPCVFHTLGSSMGQPLLSDPQNSTAVADAMHFAWIRFLRNGNPGWRAFGKEKPAYMRFDAASEEQNDAWNI